MEALESMIQDDEEEIERVCVLDRDGVGSNVRLDEEEALVPLEWRRLSYLVYVKVIDNVIDGVLDGNGAQMEQW